MIFTERALPMHFHYGNVNEAFKSLCCEWLHSNNEHITVEPSRNGSVYRFIEPVTVTYRHPKQRVLYNPYRDCNPFFHVFESLWMLAGRNDVAPLAEFVKSIVNFSDDGVTANGAYGYRWRHAHNKPIASRTAGEYEGTDQLDVIVAHLQKNPSSRRAVLQMWNVEDDLLKIDSSKDVCCNTSVMFSLREESTKATGCPIPIVTRCLDMTVTNRSNDIVWGMLGANYVHFSFLQEYMAAKVCAEVGKYHHFTNNLHAYTWNFEPERWSKYYSGYTPPFYNETAPHAITPLVKIPEQFDREVKRFIDNPEGSYNEPFLESVAKPMVKCYRAYKSFSAKGAKAKAINEALFEIGKCQSSDWRLAATAWLCNRSENNVKVTDADAQ